MKIVYVVTGSEDGILGVYGNKKGAYEEASEYVKRTAEENNFKVVSYSKVCKELKDVYNYAVEMIDDYDTEVNATIHAIPFNYNIRNEYK
jgi:hypothetical protein